MRKKTHEEYVAELADKNPNLEVIGKYVNAQTKILHRCLIHNVEWETLPGNALAGKGCKECMKEKNRIKFTKTHEEYERQIRVINPDIIAIEHYIDAKTPILHLCKKHNIKWKAYPDNILKGQGCVECGKEKIHYKKCKKQEIYIEELSAKNPTVEVIGEYIDAITPILHHCLIHDEYWYTLPNTVLNGHGCPKCLKEKISTSNSLSHEKYIEILYEKNPNIIVIDEYVNMKTPIFHECTIHNYRWKTTPSSIIQGCGCPKCRSEKISEKIRKSHEEYINQLKNINPNIIVIEKYIDVFTPILHKCLIHNCEFINSPEHMLSGTGCQQCNESRGERSVRLWLEDHCIKYEPQKIFNECRDVKPLPFDFYLPDYNLCIEYQGKQHYELVEYFGGQDNLEYVIKHDNIKENYCKENGISLLCIPYHKDTEEELNNFLFI